MDMDMDIDMDMDKEITNGSTTSSVDSYQSLLENN